MANGIADREKCFGIDYAFHSRHRYRQKLFWNSFLVADTDKAVLCSFEGGRMADKYYFGLNFDAIAEADAEKYYFRVISTMSLDKQ